MDRKKRSESFLGMHFDFHAGKDQTGIGENCAPEVIGRMLDAVRPDYVQCDTKGHNGATSYPTKVGYQAKEIVADILKMWREETAKRGISLYAHHSGVWDNLAIEHNPSWAAVNEKGEPSKEKTSVFGPYVEKLLGPQLVEMATEYDLDGVWIDGDCWAVMPDYSEHAQNAYYAKTGKKPPKSNEEGYDDFLDFCRQGFRDYVARYISIVKEKAPSFEVASNWMYTSFAPEEVTLPLDFISGDYSPQNSVNTARFEAACLVRQGKPWDLMAWGFNIQHGYHCIKTLPQLCQEAAVVIAQGGGFQFYNAQKVGTVQEWAIPIWEKLAAFCREREDICHRAKPHAQVGIVYSTKAFYHNKKNLFTAYGCPVTGAVRGSLFAAQENQYSAEILMSHHLLSLTDDELARFGMLILPNVAAIEDEVKAKLLTYAQNGGTLALWGPDTLRLFVDEINISGEITDSDVIYVEDEGDFAPIKQRYMRASTEKGTGFGLLQTDMGEKVNLSLEKPYGNGKIQAVMFDLGRAYEKEPSVVLRRFAERQLAAFAGKAMRVFGSHLVLPLWMEKEGHTFINLLNIGGAHADERQRSFDEIPPLYDLTVQISCNKPQQVVFLPERTVPFWSYDNGMLTVQIDRLDIHTVVAIE